MTNKLVCHENGNGTYILLHVSLQGQAGHLTNHAGDYVPNSPECKTETPTTPAPPTTVVEVTTVAPTPTTTGTPTSDSTVTTTPSQIETAHVAAHTVAVPGPAPFQGGELAATGFNAAAGVVGITLVAAGIGALVGRRVGRS